MNSSKTFTTVCPSFSVPNDDERRHNVRANSSADVLTLLLLYPVELVEALHVSARGNALMLDVPELVNSL